MFSKVKKAMALLITLLMIFMSAYANEAVAEQDFLNDHPDRIKVTIDGVRLVFPNVQPYIIRDRTLVPAYVLFEAMGATVQWYESTHVIMATLGKKYIAQQLYNKQTTANYVDLILDVPADMKDGEVVVPVRAVAESLGYNVDWVDATSTVVITSK